MNEHNEHAHTKAPQAAVTGELKSASPVELEKERQTPAGAGDVTPTQSRSSSPFPPSTSKLEAALLSARGTNSTTGLTNGFGPPHRSASVDRCEVVDLLHAHSRDTEHVSLGTATVHDAHFPSSPSSPFPSRSLTPKHRPDSSRTSKDMSDSSPRPDPSSGPSRSTPARRQQQHQQHASQPYGYYAPPHMSEPGLRNVHPTSSQGGHSYFAHAQQPATTQRSPGFPGQYAMSPPPTSIYSQHQVQHQYTYPHLNIPQIAPPLAHAHSHTPPEFYSISHNASPSQPPLYPPSFHTSAPPEHSGTSSLAFDYEGARNSGRSPSTDPRLPYSSQQSFASLSLHPSLTATPQFTHSHSPFSSPFPALHAQQSQRPQYPPPYAYMARASPTTSEDARQPQQQPSPTWWFIPPHSASSTTSRYPSMYYIDAYGNPSNLSLGPGFQSLPSPSPSRPLHPPAFSHRGPATGSDSEPGSGVGVTSGGSHRPNEWAQKPESVNSSSSRAPLSPSPLALAESVSERGHQQQQTREAQSRQNIRRSHLPNPPAQRSEWVMWVGNVPSDATHDELWRFFTRPIMPSIFSSVELASPYHQQLQQPPHLPAGLLSPSGSSSASDADTADASGVQSVFLIARSNCAFVNYISAAHLAAAVQRFNGIQLRPGDPRCPCLVCRIRGKEEDLKAGVGAQRGTGIHTRWVREQRERDKTRELEKRSTRRESESTDTETSASEPPSTPLSAVITESGTESSAHSSSRRAPHHSSSSGSTTSGFLARYFPKRYFILKSLTQADLDISVEKGVWATQPHNETVLNQAFRSSSDVFLIFSVNKSGEFFGYARMAGPIGKAADRVSWASRTDSQHSQHSHSPAASFASSVAGKSSQVNETIPEENEGSSPEGQQGDMSKRKERRTEKEKCSFTLFSPSEHRMAVDSPQPVTPATQKRLTSAEEVGSGKVALSAERNTAPPSNQHHGTFKDSPIQSGESRSLARPTSPTSAPAVMGDPYRKITNSRIEGLSSETMDPRLIRHHLPEIQLDSEAPYRAIRDHEPRKPGDGHPEDMNHVKRRDTFNKPASSSGSKQAESARQPTGEDLQSGPGDAGPSSRAQGEMQAQGERGDLSTQWGSPFKMQWIRVGKLPFTRTRHLRNPWNHEREVKVSRDGTELEPSVGQALLDEWDKEEPPGPETAVTGGGGSASPASASASAAGRRSALQRRPPPQAQTSPLVKSKSDLRPGSSRVHLPNQRARQTAPD